MRKLGLLLILLMLSCKDRMAVEPPSDLIPEARMEEILYELTLLQALGNSDKVLTGNLAPNRETYIYKKFEIDSLQFVNSHIYYASKPVVFQRMYERIQAKITEQKDALDQEIKGNKEASSNTATKTDSLKLQE